MWLLECHCSKLCPLIQRNCQPTRFEAEIADTYRNHAIPSTEPNFPASESTSLEAAQLTPYQSPRITFPSAGLATFYPDMDPYFINMPILTVFSALHNNSRMLGISCLYPSRRQSPPGSPDLPLTLHPVSLQMEVPHLPYIDCLPLPKLRHNLVLFNGLVDDETFCFDLTT